MVSRTAMRLLCLFCCLAVVTAAAQVTPDEIRKIDQAIPAQALQKPEQPRKILVFTLSEGFKHDAIPYAATMLELMGKKTGAFEVVQGDDMALFKPESLRRFDAVCFDNTTQLKFEDVALRKALMDFVKGGKGVIGIHAATDNFYTWPEAAEMMGGTFDNHPWTAEGTWKVEIEDPAHPLMASFNGQGFSLNDEIYRIKQVNLRKNHRVLMGLDMKDQHNLGAAGVRNSDKDIPISWIGTWGKGRIFYCSLGHNREVYWNPAVVRHYLAGIQYTLGDLQVDATPIPFNFSAFFDQKLLDQLLKDVSSYTYGQSRKPMQDLDAFVRYVSDLSGAQSRLEQQFLALLRSGATLDGKQFICSRLGHIGTGASVPTLAGLLADSTTRDMAMFALEYLPGEAVNDSLCRALASAHGKTQSGIISALGRRRAASAVAVIQPYLATKEEAVAEAAAVALANIGGPAAADALLRARTSVRGAVLLRVLDGSIKCAERFATDGDTAHALQIYKELQAKGQPVPIRLAASRGMVLLQPESAGPIILQAVQDTSSRFRSGAMQLVREVRSTETIRDIAARVSSLPPVSQVQLISALDDRRDPEVFAVMLDAAKSKDGDVRRAALKALGKTGNARAVRTFVQVAARGNQTEQRIARDGLYRLSGPAVNDSIIGLLPARDEKTKVEVLAALAARGAASAVPVVQREANNPNAAVRAEAAKALRTLAGPNDLPALVDLLVKAKGEQERKEWQTTVVVVAKKESDPARKVSAVLTAYNTAGEKQTRVSLLTVLGKVAVPPSLDALKKALKDKDADVRLTGIRGLSGWPAPDPADDLWDVAQHDRTPTHRAVALRGFVRLLGLESSRPADETAALYKRAIAQAPTLDERKRLLSSMADAQVPTALKIATDYIDDPQLRMEAELVTVRIAENIMGSYPTEVIPPLTQVSEKSKNPTASRRANELLVLVQQSGDFLTTWEYAGPFMKEGATLLSTVFPPEEANAAGVPWRVFPAGTNPQKPWLLDFKKVIGGENRVVYIRNRVWSDSSRKAVLEIGSDDGVKLWLNGALLHEYDIERLVNPGDDAVEVSLQQGWNYVILKINQRVGEWGACVKLRAPRETPKLRGIRVARVIE